MLKPTKVVLIAAAAVAVIVFAVFVSLVVSSNVIGERYSSYSDAVRNEAAAHGMVPDFLPWSATDIVAKRDLDADTLIVEFNYGNDFNASLLGLRKGRVSLPIEVLEATSFGKGDVGTLEVFSNDVAVGRCATHLVVEGQRRRAAYIYNLAPHKAGCN